jgi:ATP-binding cassette subfamily B protein
MVLEVSMDLLQPRLIASLIDDGIANSDQDTAIRLGIYMVTAAIVGLAGGMGCTWFAIRAAQHFGADLRSTLFGKVQQLSFGNLDRLETGQLITRLTNDVTQVTEVVGMVLRIMVRSPLMLVGSLILAFVTSPQLAILFVILVPVVAVTIVWVFNRSYPLFASVQRSLDRVNTVMQENLSGVRVVRAFARGEFEESRFGVANVSLTTDSVSAVRATIVAMPIMMLSTSGGMVAAVWLGGHRVANGQMQIGDLIAFLTYLTQAMMGLMFFSQLVVRVSRGEASSLRIREVLDSEPDLAVPSRPVSLNGATRGKITFENVSLRYVDGEHDVLTQVNLAIEPGETVAILGATGSGKTSLVNLVPRFYDPSEGRILIDDIDVRELDPDSLYKTIGIALQETVLFSGTIRDNIRYGRPEASDDEVIDAAKTAQAHDFISGFPDGYDSIVGQRGVNLSGGQKQRIAIARALLTESPVLILDDSTSAVDVATEARIQTGLAGVTQTRLIVAQRISSVLGADKIVVLEDGRIVAEGTHGELLAASPIYQDIYESQLETGVAHHGGR